MYNNYLIYNPTKVYFGIGSINKVGEVINDYGNKAFIVTGINSSKSNNSLNILINILKNKFISYYIFDKVISNPTDNLIDEAAKLASKFRPEVIIALGGGSSIDTAKAISVTTLTKNQIWQYIKEPLKITKTMPVIAIPTTSGTGSEVTKYAVVTNSKTKEKTDISDVLLYPRIAILDPKLTSTLSKRFTAATGIDALSQAIEAYYQINANSYTDALCQQSIRLIAENLPKAFRNGKDLNARTNMMFASLLSGFAIDGAGVILTHALEHPLSGHLNIIHGEGLAALMPEVLEYIRYSNVDKSAVVGKLLMCNKLAPSDINVHDLAKTVHEFLKLVNLDINLVDLNVKEKDIDTYVTDAFRTMGGCIKRSPLVPTKKEVKSLYEAALY